MSSLLNLDSQMNLKLPKTLREAIKRRAASVGQSGASYVRNLVIRDIQSNSIKTEVRQG